MDKTEKEINKRLQRMDKMLSKLEKDIDDALVEFKIGLEKILIKIEKEGR